VIIIRSLGRIVRTAISQLPKAIKLDGRGRTGGYLCVATKDGFQMILLVGEVADQDAVVRYRKNCEEKALRLIFGTAGFSSWETRDESKGMYGGGVRGCCDVVIAFSGFSEHVDEAFSATIMFRAGYLSQHQWEEIQSISQNPYMKKFGRLG
jgi:hypothetical protein